MQGQQAYPPFQGQSSYSSRRKAGWTRKPTPHTSFPWTDPAQIAANAQGWVTPLQHEMLKQRPWLLAGLLAYLSFLALSPSILLSGSTHQPLFLLLVFVPCGLTLLAVAWPFVQNAHRLHAPGRIMIAQGEVVWQKGQYVVQTAERSYVRAREVSGGDDSPSDYYCDLDTLSFKVTSAAYKALVDRTRYRLYYLPFMNTLLSIEPLEDPRHM